MKKSNWILIVLITGIAITSAARWWPAGNANNLPPAQEELKRLYSLYINNDTSLYITGDISLYDEKNISRIVEKTSFLFFKKDNLFYNRFGSLQTFSSDSFLVSIDSLEKNISVSKMEDTDSFEPNKAKNPVFPFEQFLADSSIYRINLDLSEKNGERKLVIQSDLNPSIASSSILYDPLTGVIHSAEIRWRKESNETTALSDSTCWLTRINYQYVTGKQVDTRQLFKKIFNVKQAVIVLSPAYAGYELDNTIY